jgi:hypothetical protein
MTAVNHLIIFPEQLWLHSGAHTQNRARHKTETRATRTWFPKTPCSKHFSNFQDGSCDGRHFWYKSWPALTFAAAWNKQNLEPICTYLYGRRHWHSSTTYLNILIPKLVPPKLPTLDQRCTQSSSIQTTSLFNSFFAYSFITTNSRASSYTTASPSTLH